MLKDNLRIRVHPSNETTSSSSLDVESIKSFDIKDEPGFQFSKNLLGQTKENVPCEPDEIFECLKYYFLILKAAGVYFENPKEMEEIKRKQKEKLRLRMTNAFQNMRQRNGNENMQNSNMANVLFNAGMNVLESKQAWRSQFISKLHRIYCTIMLVFHWTNVIRGILMVTPNDTFSPELFFKLTILTHLILSAGMVTAFYWACASGRLPTVMIGLSGIRGVDKEYIIRLGRTTCFICGGMMSTNLVLMIFGWVKLEWMYEPLGSPINTWIITENKSAKMFARGLILFMLIFVPLGSSFISSFGMLLSLILRRSLVFIKQDLKSSMIFITSVEEKKQEAMSRPGTARSGCRDSTSIMDLDMGLWKTSTSEKAEAPFSSFRRKSIRQGDTTSAEARKDTTFEQLRQRYQFITKLIRKSDSFVSITNAFGIIGFLGEVIFLLYTLLWYSCRFQNAGAYLATLSFWLLNAFVSLVYMFIPAVYIHNAAQRVFEKIHDIDMSQYSLETLNQFSIFLTRMTTDNVGFSIFHLFVIDRDKILTILNLFLTYFLLIYQLNPDTSEYCAKANSVNVTEPNQVIK